MPPDVGPRLEGSDLTRETKNADDLMRAAAARAQLQPDVDRLTQAIGQLHQLRGFIAGKKLEFPNAPRPCHTCAFNPSTDKWRGWDTTANGLQKAIQADRPFYCHENIPWRKPVLEWTPEDHRGFEDQLNRPD